MAPLAELKVEWGEKGTWCRTTPKSSIGANPGEIIT